MHPPNPLAVTNAIEMLTQLGALGGKEEITNVFVYYYTPLFFFLISCYSTVGRTTGIAAGGAPSGKNASLGPVPGDG